MMIIIVFFVLLVSPLRGAPPPQKVVTVSICDLLENRLTYDGQMVEIRGVLESSQEGSALVGERCRSHIVINGLSFPSAVNLASHFDITSPHYETAEFVQDGTQIEEVAQQVGRLRRKYPHAKIVVTYRGLFETRSTIVASNLSGDTTRAGFGHLGACPGQLVVQTAKDPRVEMPNR